MIPILAASEIDEIAALVFVDIAIIVVVARLMGALFRKFRQPAVVGEIIAGIALGPSLLGLLPGDLPGVIFPTEVRPFLSVVAQLGLVIFMFIVGLELDLNLIKGKERVAAVISLSSVALPFGLGFALASWLHPLHDEIAGFPQVEFLPFALFLGAAMSITAFPVLARILTDRGMYRTEIGALTLACAAVDDILAWSLLAVVIAIAQATSLATLPVILVQTLVYVAVMFLVVKPLLAKVAQRYRAAGRLTPEILAIVLIGILLSSYATDRIGVHSIFGAFVFGAVMPRRETAQFFHDILQRLEHVTVLLLLPVFFIATGLQVDVRGLGLSSLPQLGAILLVAVAGKFFGAALAARAQGVKTQKASAIGVLMNTRGLTELVILNVGASIGVLDPPLFTMMVIMAVLTTVMTEPLLRLVYPDRQLERDVAEAERAALGIVDAYRVLISVEDPADAEHLVDVALAAIGPERPSEIVLTRFVPRDQAGAEISAGLVAELAAVASSNAALSAQSARVQAHGVECTVLSRFSDDVAHDLVTQAAALEADVILLGRGGDAFLQQLRREAPCDVVTMLDPHNRGVPPGRPVLALTGERDHDQAAVELAVRLADGLGAGARLLDDPAGGRRQQRRTATLVDEAVPLGVSVTTGSVSELNDLARDAGAVVIGAERPLPDLDVAAFVVSAPPGAARGGFGEMVRNRQRQQARPAEQSSV